MWIVSGWDDLLPWEGEGRGSARPRPRPSTHLLPPLLHQHSQAHHLAHHCHAGQPLIPQSTFRKRILRDPTTLLWRTSDPVSFLFAFLNSNLISKKKLPLKGHGNEPVFPMFLHKSLWPRSLTLPFKPFRFWLWILGDIHIRKSTPRLPASVSREVDKIACSMHFFQIFK